MKMGKCVSPKANVKLKEADRPWYSAVLLHLEIPLLGRTHGASVFCFNKEVRISIEQGLRVLRKEKEQCDQPPQAPATNRAALFSSGLHLGLLNKGFCNKKNED